MCRIGIRIADRVSEEKAEKRLHFAGVRVIFRWKRIIETRMRADASSSLNERTPQACAATQHSRSQAMNQNRSDNERTTRIVTLDFNGGSHVYRNPELGMNIPVRIAPSGISANRARMLEEALNRNCAD